MSGELSQALRAISEKSKSGADLNDYELLLVISSKLCVAAEEGKNEYHFWPHNHECRIPSGEDDEVKDGEIEIRLYNGSGNRQFLSGTAKSMYQTLATLGVSVEVGRARARTVYDPYPVYFLVRWYTA